MTDGLAWRAVEGTQTLVPDNGDQLTGAHHHHGTGTTSVHPSAAVMPVAGGTEHFVNAGGAPTINRVATPVLFDGVTLLEHIDCKLTGELSY